MVNYKVEFEKMEWEIIAMGAKQKLYTSEDKSIRLLRLEDDFHELDWCTKGHIGYILDGEMTLNFSGETENFKEGDIFVIPKGESNKHKAKIRKGKYVELLMVEEI